MVDGAYLPTPYEHPTKSQLGEQGWVASPQALQPPNRVPTGANRGQPHDGVAFVTALIENTKNAVQQGR